MSNSYRDLIVWQKARLLVHDVYSATKHFPVDERFGLVTQLRRAGVSVVANIAEVKAAIHPANSTISSEWQRVR